ncbi:MAG: DNA primase [Anaerolineae bacterium]|nr:DNA primase [Anaerolineae bacterium]
MQPVRYFASGAIPVSAIDEIKNRLDIVELISSYLPLQKAGRNYKALCPFHSEKTPSFVVFPDSQRWHCFGACGEGGDIFTFVMKREGWDFRTALEELARRAGVELHPRTPAQARIQEETERLRALLDTAARYYHRLLLHAPEAREARAYVARRGLSSETVERFMLGYSLAGWDNVRNYLTEQGYSVEELLKAGLLVQREDGGTYDRFRERLMIPIRDRQGHVIGFGARTLDPHGTPKYINSPQTPLFDKSQVLFGLDLAGPAIRREEYAVIVEGYMDVMQAHQAGFANVVAQMGTALTEAQLRQLQRYTRRLVLALDPDAAGVRATLRGIEVAREVMAQAWEPVFDPRGLVGYESRLGAEIRILCLPSGKDPDALIRESPQQWAELLKEAIPVVDFYLQVLLEEVDPGDTKAKARLVDTLVPILRAVANPVEREDYVQKVARALRIDVRAVHARLAEASRKTPQKQPEATRTAVEQEPGEADLEGHLLSLLLQRPGLLPQVNEILVEQQVDIVKESDFQNVGYRAIFGAWEELVSTASSELLETLRIHLPADLHTHLAELLQPDISALAEEQLVRDAVLTLLRLRKRNLERWGQELQALRMEAQQAGDVRAKQYDRAQLAHTEALRRTQRALAQRWNWTARYG